MTFTRERRGWEGDKKDGDKDQVGLKEEEKEEGSFNITISSCLKRGARLGRIRPHGSPTTCSALVEQSDEPIVGSLGGILYLTGPARDGVVCLEGQVIEHQPFIRRILLRVYSQKTRTEQLTYLSSTQGD